LPLKQHKARARPTESKISAKTLLSATIVNPVEANFASGARPARNQMDDALAAQLLTAIECDRLIVFCGAGASMAAPSNLPPAWRLANECADKYEQMTGMNLPADHKNNLEILARYFKNQNELQATFIGQLVDWTPFNGMPNAGHETVADLLSCRALESCVTTNYDLMIENAAKGIGVQDFRPIVVENDINRNTDMHAPMLKLHGCADRERWNTVWCVEQLAEAPWNARIPAFRTWVNARLLQRDLLFVGFWSDWAYLNDVLDRAFVGTEPRSITVVDPSDTATLQAKAPLLWALAHRPQASFRHVRAPGEQFLADLRQRFSRQFLTRLINSSRMRYQQLFGACAPDLGELPAGLGIRELFNLRRGFCGQPATSPPREKRPGTQHLGVGVVHIALMQRGAILDGYVYRLPAKTVRLLHASGEYLSQVKARFTAEPPGLPAADQTLCVGAYDDVAPAHIIHGATPPGIVRGGISGDWRVLSPMPAEIGAVL
jgi:SIR2-like domain